MAPQFLSFFLAVLIFLCAPSFLNADDTPGGRPVVTQKRVVTTEHISSEEDQSNQIDRYRTTVYQETEEDLLPAGFDLPDGVVLAEQPRSYRSAEFFQYEAVVVTALRNPVPRKQVADNMTVVTREEILRMPARDLGEVLSYVPGVHVQLGGQFGQVSALSINGAPSRQVRLMIDGIPVNTQLSGQGNPAQFPVNNIERIEIIKGASSSAWGSALGGVVNVVTRDTGDTARPRGSFRSSFAEFSTTENSLDFAGKAGGLGYLFTGSFYETDGAQAYSEARDKKYFTKFSHPLGDTSRIVGSFGYNEAHTRYALSTSSSVVEQPYFTRYGKLGVETEQEDFRLGLDVKFNDQDIISDFFGIPAGDQVFSTVSSNFYKGVSLNGAFDVTDNSVLVAGVDADWHRLKSNRYLDSGKEIKMQGYYAHYTLSVDRLDLIPGFRYDHNDRFGSQSNPSLGAVYAFDDERETLVRGKVARAFNAPPLLWIYNYSPAFFVGPNPDLKAERAIVYELGFETKLLDALGLELNLYRSNVEDGIALEFDTDDFLFVQRNIRKFRRQGVELLLDYALNDRLSFYGSGAFNDAENRDTKATVRDQGVARQRYTFGARYSDAHGWGANLYGTYNRWSSGASLKANDRKPIFDLKLSKRFEAVKQDLDLELFLNIHNLTNSKYWSDISFPLPERYFEGGFSVHF
ncbi:MAG: TonB-dependent receptor plug domain-containing protein [Candidatus Omnitrophota bacterium]